MGIWNCFGFLPRFANEKFKRRFLISNVCEQLDAGSRGTCLPRSACWAGMF